MADAGLNLRGHKDVIFDLHALRSLLAAVRPGASAYRQAGRHGLEKIVHMQKMMMRDVVT